MKGEALMKINGYNWIMLAILTGLVMGACSDIGISGSDPLEGTSWELVAYRKSKPIPGRSITATFEGGQISGSAGCNTYFGAYQVDGEKITISDLANTEMACLEPEGLMDQETLILGFLRDAQTFQVGDSQLMIFQSDGEALTFIHKE